MLGAIGDSESRFTLHSAVCAGPFRITHKSYSRGFSQTWHEHDEASIDFVLQGGGRGSYAGEDVVSRAGTVEYFAAGLRHRFESAETGIRTLHVVLSPELARASGVLADTLVRELDASRAIGPGYQLLHEMSASRAPDPLLLESLAWELLDQVDRSGREPADDGSWLARVRESLIAEPSRAHSLASLADDFGVHRSHLARQFRRAHGITVGEFGRRVRLARAARALAAHDPPPIALLALEFGFSDQAHFTRAFQAAYGCTPARFRRRLARAPER